MTTDKKFSKIKEILARKNGVADNQEFGLSYGQAIGYLDEIEEAIKDPEDELMEKEFLINEHEKEIAQLAEELYKLIDYDEWSAREYGETEVDYYGTAFNLLEAGYRKVTDLTEN